MNILIVKPILPYPPTQGTRRVTMILLRAIAATHTVDLLVPLQSADQKADAAALEREVGCRVVGCPAPNRRSPFHRAWYKLRYFLESLVGGHSPRALYATPAVLLSEAGRLSEEKTYDLAVFEYWYTYRVFDRVRATRKVLLAHDYEFEVNRRASGDPARRRWSVHEAGRELEACRKVDEVWALTEEDAAALARASEVSRERFRVFPFGVNVKTLNPPEGGAGESVLFFGSFLADFNLDALDFLVEEIWPRLKMLRPTARLTVAGAGLSAGKIRRLGQSGILHPGTVHDVAELYGSAAVVMIPLRYGGGLRIRLLEAMSCSRAVVATRIGAGTIGKDGVHLLVADDADAFASAVALLLEDPARAGKIGAAARRLVESEYSENAATEGIRKLVEGPAGVRSAD